MISLCHHQIFPTVFFIKLLQMKEKLRERERERERESYLLEQNKWCGMKKANS